MVLEIKDLNFKYSEDAVLKGINLEIAKGKFYSIIGPNGSGKTTFLKTLGKQLAVKEKTVFLLGSDIYPLKEGELAKKISLVPQNTYVAFDLAGEEIVMMGRTPYLKPFSREGQKDFRIVEECMQKTNTWHLRKKSIKSISGGERQRVILARALAQKGEIMLLDEPVSQLDIKHQLGVMETLKALVKEGLTVICVLHDLNLASQYSDEIILIKDGALVNLGTPEQVLTEEMMENIYGVNCTILKDPYPIIIKSSLG